MPRSGWSQTSAAFSLAAAAAGRPRQAVAAAAEADGGDDDDDDGGDDDGEPTEEELEALQKQLDTELATMFQQLQVGEKGCMGGEGPGLHGGEAVRGGGACGGTGGRELGSNAEAW